jgi:hypothetical protein
MSFFDDIPQHIKFFFDKEGTLWLSARCNAIHSESFSCEDVEKLKEFLENKSGVVSVMKRDLEIKTRN